MLRSLQTALETAAADAHRASFAIGSPDGRRRSRRIVMGDPQASVSLVMEILARHGLLADDGRLHPDVMLVSIGDHFDWGEREDRERARIEGLQLLAWLAAHPADQVKIILGNHDLGRVGEIAGFDDARFESTQAAADAIYGKADAEAEARFAARFGVVTSELVARDFSSFSVAQRELVTQLLHASRFEVAFAASDHELVCHAGVTTHDLRTLGLSPANHRDAAVVASALNEALAAAVATWRDGEPLAIEPCLHCPGRLDGGEGRGIFYHRASNPAGRDHGHSKLFDGPPRRRFDPRDLPIGLMQVIGHVRDKKCRDLLDGWCDTTPARNGTLRHLTTDGRGVRYTAGLPASTDAASAMLVFTDGGMAHCAADAYALYDLDAGAVAQAT